MGLWRLLGVQQAGGPVWVPQTGSKSSPGRSVDGQQVAVLNLVITAVPLEWIEPE